MPRILVIEDDPVMLEFMRIVLQETGYEVETAEGGVEGMKAIERTDLDLVVTDIYMPDMDGLEIVREIKARFPDLKTLAMTSGGSHDNVSVLIVAEVFGADASLKKPFSKDELTDCVERTLAA